MVYDLEFEKQKPYWYLSLSCRYKQSVRDAIVKINDVNMENIITVESNLLNDVRRYKGLARCGFSDKSYEIYRHEKQKKFSYESLKELYEAQISK